MPLVNWVNRQADTLLRRSTWGRYRLAPRILLAVVSWIMGMAGSLAVLTLVGASSSEVLGVLVPMGLWVTMLLTAFCSHSRGLMRATVWAGCGLPVLLVVGAAVTAD